MEKNAGISRTDRPHPKPDLDIVLPVHTVDKESRLEEVSAAGPKYPNIIFTEVQRTAAV